MLNIASLISSLASLWGKLLDYFKEKRLIQAGRDEAVLEGKEHAEKLADDIKHAQSDDGVRLSTRKKYTRK